MRVRVYCRKATSTVGLQGIATMSTSLSAALMCRLYLVTMIGDTLRNSQIQEQPHSYLECPRVG